MSNSDNNIILGAFELQARAAASEWRENSCYWADEIEITADPVEMNRILSTAPFNDQVLAFREDWEAAASYSADGSELYEKITQPKQMVTIAAPSGRGKSLLATNCAAYAIQNGRRVLWVNMDMALFTTHERLACMLTGLSPDELRQKPEILRSSIRVLMHRGVWQVLDMTTSPPRSQAEFESLLARCAAICPMGVVVIDGFDRVASASSQEFGERCQYAAAWAENAGICLMVTSQTTRKSANNEIIDVNDLAFSMGKGYASDIVVTIGHGVQNEIRTVCVAKDRNRIFTDKQVFRLDQSPSLRMEAMEIHDSVSVSSRSTIPLPVYVNCSEQEVEVLEADIDGEVDDGTSQGQGTGGTKLYHGTNGHLSIGCRVFDSAIYQSLDLVSLGRLLSLYEMGAWRETKLQAPGTNIPVSIRRGQVLTSLQILAHQWKTDKKNVERFLDRLVADRLIKVEHVISDGGQGRIATTSDTMRKKLASVITLCHYDTNDGANEKYGRQSDPTNDTMLSQ
jgi:archaellum biogenesis ATPase FlaH